VVKVLDERVDVPVQPCVLLCVGSALCLNKTRVDSRCPRHTDSSSGVRPRASSRCISCCNTHTYNNNTKI